MSNNVSNCNETKKNIRDNVKINNAADKLQSLQILKPQIWLLCYDSILILERFRTLRIPDTSLFTYPFPVSRSLFGIFFVSGWRVIKLKMTKLPSQLFMSNLFGEEGPQTLLDLYKPFKTLLSGLTFGAWPLRPPLTKSWIHRNTRSSNDTQDNLSLKYSESHIMSCTIFSLKAHNLRKKIIFNIESIVRCSLCKT